MKKGIIFLMIILMSSSVFAAIVSHEASEINSGNFSGDYKFQGDIKIASLNSTGDIVIPNDVNGGALLVGSFGNKISRDSTDGSLDIVSGQDDIILLPAGNVGIGTNNPSVNHKLEIVSAGGSTEVGIINTADAESIINFGNSITDPERYSGRISYQNSVNRMQFSVDSNFGSPEMVIDNGNVGIGTVNPNYKLEINGTNLAVALFSTIGGNKIRINDNVNWCIR